MTTARTRDRHRSIARAIRVGVFVGLAALMLTPAASASIAIFAGDCSTPSTSFDLGETVCVKAEGLTGYRLAWVTPDGYVVDKTDVTSDPQLVSFALPSGPTSSIGGEATANNLGSWRVNALTSRSSVKTSVLFTVRDPENARVDLALVNDVVGGDSPVPGGAVRYEITLLNAGPDNALNAHFVDDAFSNATFDSLLQTGGPQFSCTGADCTIAAFPAGAVATFLLNFTAGSAGGVLENTARFTSDTVELRPDDNTTAAPTLRVTSAGAPPSCVLDCGGNLVVSVNTTMNGNPGAIITLPAPETNGTCGPVTLSPPSGSFFPVGTTTVTATAGDGSCSFTVTVINTAPPTISCPANISVTALSMQPEAFVPDPQGAGSDPGSAAATGSNVSVIGLRSDDRPLSDAYPIGLTQIRWTVTDDGGRTASCTQRITVTSPDTPTIHCPPDKTFAAPAGQCEITVTADNIGTPAVTGPGTVVTSRRSDDASLANPFPGGLTTITWTATNDLGSVSCVQAIQVRTSGIAPPVLTLPPDISVTTSNCFVILDDELGIATAVSVCDVTIVRTGVPANFVFPTGTTDIKYTATDSAGNSRTGIQHVQVLESPAIRPTINAPSDVSVNTGLGATACGAILSDAALGNPTASDNCSFVSVSRAGVPSGNFFPVGDTFVTYKATDASGNVSTAAQKVTVVDTTPPVIACPLNIVLESTCPSGAIATWTAPVGTDNCAATTTQTAGLPLGSVFPIGQTATVTYTATDAAGSSTSCSFTVKVLTVLETFANLSASVQSTASLNGPTKQGLVSKLDSAVDALAKGKTDQACQMIQNFANSTQNFIDHGDVPTAAGQSWLKSAAHVTNALGCTNDPCS